MQRLGVTFEKLHADEWRTIALPLLGLIFGGERHSTNELEILAVVCFVELLNLYCFDHRLTVITQVEVPSRSDL